jgi:dTDP-4-amino-4,6-dideoxy-D-galactose acyltransferase
MISRKDIEESLISRIDKLFFYSPYNFIAGIDRNLQIQRFVKEYLNDFDKSESNQVIVIEAGGNLHYFFLNFLSWDTEFFGIKTYRLFTVLYAHHDYNILSEAIGKFSKAFFSDHKKYCFIKIPSEDILLIQALGNNGFKLIETRNNYYKDSISEFQHERYDVRKAKMEDAEHIGRISSQTRNPYDRFHAEVVFTPELGDEFLGRYAIECLNGLSDIVLLPDNTSDAFLAVSSLKNDSKALNCNMARIILVAVGSVSKGWHMKLVSEAIYYSKSIQAEYLLMTTQSTNRAVFRTNEKLGLKLGGVEHIFSISN